MARTHRMVVGIDGSEGSVHALLWAVTQAATRGGTVEAVTTYDMPGIGLAVAAGLGSEGERRRAEDVLARAVTAATREYPQVPVTAKAVLGGAAHKLTEIARDADLLVVGSRRHSRLHQAVLGSVSEACIRLATCPVVLVPDPYRDKGIDHTGGPQAG